MARVIFLQRIWYEYGGPEIISAVLKKHGHEVELLIGKNADCFLGQIKTNDIVAFSTMSGEHHWALKIANQIKNKKKVLTVFGGAHPTYFPDIINNPCIDIVCCGEGEFVMLDLARAYDNRSDFANIPNLWVKQGSNIKKNEVRHLVSDLDSLPFPDREVYYNRYKLLRESSLKPFMASRGCPFSCSFCFNEKLRSMYVNKGSYVRFRSPMNLIDEIKEVERKYGLKSVYFADDLFVFDKKWLEGFIELYRKRVNKPFVCSANVNTLNEDVIKLLKEGGCHTVSFGIETGNERLRFELLNKRITNKHIEEVGSLLRKYKLKFMTFNMIGLPNETIENALETVRLNIKIKTDYPRCSILTPYPGTEIAERYKDKININDIYSTNQQAEISFDVSHPKELRNIHYFFQTAVIFPYSFWLIKKLIRLPANILFRLWWSLIYFLVFAKSETRNIKQTFSFAIKTVNLVFGKDN